MQQPSSLQEWQEIFDEIYGEEIDFLGLNLEGTFIMLVSMLRRISKGVQTENKESLSKNLPILFAWLCLLSNKLQIDLTEITFNKYPGRCPYCGAGEDCLCVAAREKPELTWRMTNSVDESSRDEYKTLDDFQYMFERIYGNTTRIIGLPKLSFHLVEEIAEIAEAIIKYKFHSNIKSIKERLYDEIADALGRILTICNISELNLSEITWQTFQNGCPSCGQEICQCHLAYLYI